MPPEVPEGSNNEFGADNDPPRRVARNFLPPTQDDDVFRLPLPRNPPRRHQQGWDYLSEEEDAFQVDHQVNN